MIWKRIKEQPVNHEKYAVEFFDNLGLARLKDPEYLRDIDLAFKLSISIHTIRKWKSQGKIPFRQFGRAIRYKMDEVVDAISSFKKR